MRNHPSRPQKRAIRTALACAMGALLLQACQPVESWIDPATRTGHGNGQTAAGPNASYRPASEATTEILEVPSTGINLGWGWNAVDSEPVPSVCVEFAEASEPAQTRHMSMREVSDNYELMQSMGMSAEASVKTIGFEASGKASFAKEQKISRFASNFVLNATVENGVRYAAPLPLTTVRAGTASAGVSSGPTRGDIRLTAEALALARQRDLGEFIHRCGHGFVSAIYSGAKLTALITVNTSSRAEHQKVSSEMAGSGWGARLNANLTADASTGGQKKDMSISVFQTGGRGDSIPTNQTETVAKLKDLSAIAFDAPKDFHMAVAPYETLSNWPARSIEVDQNEYDQVATLWGAYNSLYDDVQDVLNEPGQFVGAVIDPASGCVAMEALATAVTHPVQLLTGTTVVASTPPTSPTETMSVAAVNSTTATVVRARSGQVQNLEQVQDEVLDNLKRLRQFAAECASSNQGCTFDEGTFRSPYAYRIQMPVEYGGVNRVISPEDVLDTHVAGPAKRRCAENSGDLACQSNEQVRAWRDKLGMRVVRFDTVAERDALVQHLRQLDLASLPSSCTAQAAHPPYSVEPDFPALWFDPRIQACVSDPKAGRDQCLG